jgi:hypothetical protein
MCYLCLWNFMVNLMLRLFFTWGNYVINLMLLKINVRIMWVLSMLAELVLVRNSTSLLLVRIMWVILRWNFCLCVFKLVTERDVQWANYKQKKTCGWITSRRAKSLWNACVDASLLNLWLWTACVDAMVLILWLDLWSGRVEFDGTPYVCVIFMCCLWTYCWICKLAVFMHTVNLVLDIYVLLVKIEFSYGISTNIYMHLIAGFN